MGRLVEIPMGRPKWDVPTEIPMGRSMGISMGRPMGRPMGIPMGRPMGRPMGNVPWKFPWEGSMGDKMRFSPNDAFHVAYAIRNT